MPNLGKMFASSSFTEEAASLITKPESEADVSSLESERVLDNYYPSLTKKSHSSAVQRLNKGPIYLFYFMKPEDTFQAVLINIIYRLRMAFANIGKEINIQNEWFSQKTWL